MLCFPCQLSRGYIKSPSYDMNSLLNLTNSPTLPTNGSEQDQQQNIAQPARRERKARTETSTRHTWSKEDNIQLMTLYYQSQPSRSGYRRRLRSLWDDAGLFTCTEQRLADQARSIRNNNLLSDIELLGIFQNYRMLRCDNFTHFFRKMSKKTGSLLVKLCF